jgi:regulator of RNase E activity RraB
MSMRSTVAICFVLLSLGCEKKSPSGSAEDRPVAETPVPEVKRVLPEGTYEGPGLSGREQELINAGSDPKKEHRIEHHVVLVNSSQAAEAKAWGDENGFETSPVLESVYEEQKSFSVDFVREIPLDVDLINLDRRRIENFTMSLNVDYDGWGCVVVQ